MKTLDLISFFVVISGETTTDGQDELSKTPTNKNSSNDSITESSDKTETFQQRKEEAKSRRRKKKKTNSSVVATAFQVKNFVFTTFCFAYPLGLLTLSLV